MTGDLGFLDVLAFLLFALILYFLSVISKRLGEAMGLKKYYYLYYIGMFFLVFGSIMMILSQEAEFFGYVSFSVGISLGLIASIRYWGWLIKELSRGL